MTTVLNGADISEAKATWCGHVGTGAAWAHGLEAMTVRDALTSTEQPRGALLLECQGQRDLAHVRALVAKLARRMASDGRTLNEDTQADAVGAGVLALTQWRSGQTVDGDEFGAAGVAWRAIVTEVSRDTMGEVVSFDALPPESLAGSALPLPGWYEERTDKASRLAFERARAQRPGLLARRIEAIKAQGGRGKRAELVERVHRACILLFNGADLDSAAKLAGFKASANNRVRASDRFAQAVRRIGFKFQLNSRQTGADIRLMLWAVGGGNGRYLSPQARTSHEHLALPSPVTSEDGSEKLSGELKHPLPLSIAAAWSSLPSATLQDRATGRGPRHLVKLSTARKQSRSQSTAAQSKQFQRAAHSAQLASNQQRLAVRRRELDRWTARRDPARARGAWPSALTVAGAVVADAKLNTFPRYRR